MFKVFQRFDNTVHILISLLSLNDEHSSQKDVSTLVTLSIISLFVEHLSLSLELVFISQSSWDEYIFCCISKGLENKIKDYEIGS